MGVVAQTGYLETAYLSSFSYMSGQIGFGAGLQSEMIIKPDEEIGFQSQMVLGDLKEIGFQSQMVVEDEKPSGLQALMQIQNPDDDPHIGMQAQMAVKPEAEIGMQSRMFVETEKETGMQSEMNILDRPSPTGMQTNMVIKDELPVGQEVRATNIAHWRCEKYLNNAGYLTDSYLAPCIRAMGGWQTQMKIQSPDDDPHIGFQSQMVIKDSETTGMQARMVVETEKPVGMQAIMLAREITSMQSNMVIYNTTQFRLLCDFASRGTPALGGNNWTSVQPIRAGDFDPSNLNTDIIEQRCETDGVKSLWQLRCDTGVPQGVFVDTVALLNHNFTRSARVTLQGTNDPTYGSIGFSVVMETELENMYYIAPTLPTAGYRYWQFVIEDPTNPEDNLSLGVVLFGASGIFTLKETFDNPVTFGNRHYKDSIETEGFNNVSNDRATRKFLGLTFAELLYDGGNYALLQNYFKTAKTDVKCLVIPRPTRPSAFAVFSKLTQLPEEQHNSINDSNHYVTLSLDWDESL